VSKLLLLIKKNKIQLWAKMLSKRENTSLNPRKTPLATKVFKQSCRSKKEQAESCPLLNRFIEKTNYKLNSSFMPVLFGKDLKIGDQVFSLFLCGE